MAVSLVEPQIHSSLRYTIFDSPLGKIGVATSLAGICRVMLSISNEPEFIKELKKLHPNPKNKRNQLLLIEKEFNLYFNKKLKNFSFKIDIRQGTIFQKRVWRKLMSIPFGKVRSYQWLASEIGRPKAFRAAGNANSKNPIPIIVPCHRIIRKNGETGGFTGGTHLKNYLLELENYSHASF